MDAASLAAVFAQTTSPDPAPRKAAEEFLQRAALQPGFGLALLQLAATSGADEGVRQAAAVAFKNHVKFQWAPPELEIGAVQPAAIGAPEKEHIKGGIVDLMLVQPQRIQAQLGEALALMAASDFPDRWPTLLPELLPKLGSPDVNVVNGVLTVADTIFRRFRDQYKTVELVKDIKYVLSLFVDPMLELFKATGLRLAGPEGSTPEGVRQLLTTVLHICRIFFSLNYQELPGAWRARRCAPPRLRRRPPNSLTGPCARAAAEVFEDHMAEWLLEFQKYLTYENPALVEADPSKESVVDQVGMLRLARCTRRSAVRASRQRF